MFRSPLSRFSSQRALCAAIAACFGSVAVAQPVGMTAIHGTASTQQDGARTTITTTNGAGTRHSAIDWRGFSVPAERSVYFAQPDAASLSINRVTGSDPSGIFGTLGSNGRLVLVNPAGIAVGAGAVVDTAGFTASTLPMSTADAIAGRLNFGTGDMSANAAKLSVDGQVLARNGDVVLIGPRVETGAQAVVRAEGGDVILAAGRKVYLTGRGLEGIRFEVRAPDDRAVNLGRLQGDSVAIFAGLLQHSGTIRAEGREGRGGSVHLSADRIVLKAAASLDASHANGGGEILVGGGWQGRDARIANALSVDVEEGVMLKADATLSGHGGTVVVWSDDTTRFRGKLTALGAGPNGAGGRAEVSGKRQLVFRGKVDLGAANGQTGHLLLDPDSVTIRGGSGAGSDSGDTVFESELEGMNANITIQANRKIEAKGSFGSNELLVAPDRNLRLEVVGSGSGGILLADMPIRTQGSGSVELLTAGKDQDIRPGRITTAGGGITLAAAQSDLRLDAALDSAGGAVTLAGKKLEMNAVQTFAAGTAVTVNATSIDHKGTLVLGEGATFATGGTGFSNRKEGIVAGSGRLDLGGGTLVNEGTLRPGGAGAVGDLAITGELEMKKDARLEIDVAGPARYDRLLVSGKARLDGDLELAPLGYVPAASDSYALLESSAVSGRFDKFGKDSATAGSFPGFQPAYQATRVVFGGKVNANGTPTVPQPSGSTGTAGNAPAEAPRPKFVDTAAMGSGPAHQELAPLAEQPVAVQAAVQQPAASTEAFLAQVPAVIESSESQEAAAAKRRIRVTAVQCRAE